jgi:cytochrome c553
MIKYTLTSILLLMMALSAHAGDINAGQEKSSMCQGCHGADGNSPAGMWPTLAGQHAKYLTKQIKDFQAGNRKNETMESMVAGLSDEDIADISAYFSSQKPASSGTADDEGLITLGHKIYKGGNMESRLMACAGCHGPNATGNSPAKFPSLIGQQSEYVITQLSNFAEGSRSNDINKMMQNVATKMSKKEMEAVAAYLASLGN